MTKYLLLLLVTAASIYLAIGNVFFTKGKPPSLRLTINEYPYAITIENHGETPVSFFLQTAEGSQMLLSSSVGVRSIQESFSSIDFAGICHKGKATDNSSLVALFNSRGTDDPTEPSDLQAIDLQTLEISHHELTYGQSARDVVVCNADQTLNGDMYTALENDDYEITFTPCECNYEVDHRVDAIADQFSAFQYNDERFVDLPLAPNLPTTLIVSERTIDNELMNTVSSEAVAELSQRDRLHSLHAHQLQSNQYKIATVTFSGTSVWDSWHLLLFQAADDNKWQVIYSAQQNSKSANHVTLDKFQNSHEVKMTMCVEDCDWHGVNAEVVLNLSTLQLRLAKN